MSPFWFGGELNGKQANCDGNFPYETGKGPYLERPSVMGSYGANPFGLCDQHGQVWESCQDCFGPEQDWYEDEDEDNDCASWPADPTGASSGSSRVLWGGSWRHNAVRCRSAYRHGNAPSRRHDSIGFRLLGELR